MARARAKLLDFTEFSRQYTLFKVKLKSLHHCDFSKEGR